MKFISFSFFEEGGRGFFFLGGGIMPTLTLTFHNLELKICQCCTAYFGV